MNVTNLTIMALRAYIEQKEDYLRRYGFRTLPPDRKVIEAQIGDAKQLLNWFNDERARVVIDE